MSFWSDLLELLIRIFGKKPAATKLTLPPPGVGGLGQTAIIKGRLTKANNMPAIPNANVTVTVTPPSGTPVTTTKVTDANGAFSVAIPLVVEGTYGVKADFAGNADWKPSSGTTSVVALPAPKPTTLTLTPSAPSGPVGQTLTINAVLQG
jgi:uncharacterized protein YfaS (alpha-2-macroglobulin family)